jgi:hypothetical protein
MPLFELTAEGLTPFQRLNPGPDLYEKEIEDLVWMDLEAFTGEVLFPVARQPKIAAGGIPDVLALDEAGHVVIIEVKRDLDRGQLAQCLEYAGWARMTNLDEIASLYDRKIGSHSGTEAFFADWQAFTETTTPLTITGPPRLVLIARDFHGRTKSALDFLRDSNVPVTVIPVTVYQDDAGRKIVDVEAEHEPNVAVAAAQTSAASSKKIIKTVDSSGRRVSVKDLIDAGLLQAGDSVIFERPKIGVVHDAVICADGSFELPGGEICKSPSLAAMKAADVISYDGWFAWRVVRTGKKIGELRNDFVDASFLGDI